jgi:hypothetical protein
LKPSLNKVEAVEWAKQNNINLAMLDLASKGQGGPEDMDGATKARPSEKSPMRAKDIARRQADDKLAPFKALADSNANIADKSEKSNANNSVALANTIVNNTKNIHSSTQTTNGGGSGGASIPFDPVTASLYEGRLPG